MHPVPRYVLSVGKGGSKLKPASGSGQGCQPVGGGGGRGGDPASAPNIGVECHNLSAAEIGDNLHQMAGEWVGDHDVVDETKLTEQFDFQLEWTGRGARTRSRRISLSNCAYCGELQYAQFEREILRGTNSGWLGPRRGRTPRR
jgi:uncharacterized protein (TIGR03435 family)